MAAHVIWACRSTPAPIELIVVDPTQRKPAEPPADSTDTTAERRRLGRVVHDDRGTARVEWHDAPPDYERPKLEVEDTDDTVRRLAILNDGAPEPFNPYNRKAEARRAPPAPTQKRDLRKLSEWIKMMRGMEERKQNDSDDSDG